MTNATMLKYKTDHLCTSSFVSLKLLHLVLMPRFVSGKNECKVKVVVVTNMGVTSGYTHLITSMIIKFAVVINLPVLV